MRSFNAETLELVVDFVLHDIEGPAATWANTCGAGDTIRIMGPGPKKLVDYSGDWFLLVGDMSALPAISANIEGMPTSARGYALLEIIEAADAQDLEVPDALEVRWIINEHSDQAGTILLDAVRQLDWLDGEPSIWVAGEFSTTLAVRKHLKEERRMPRAQLYASSYWQIGRSEDEHKVSKAAAKDV